MPPRKRKGTLHDPKKHYPKYDPRCNLCGGEFHPEERPKHVWRRGWFITYVCGHCAPEEYLDEELRLEDDTEPTDELRTT